VFLGLFPLPGTLPFSLGSWGFSIWRMDNLLKDHRAPSLRVCFRQGWVLGLPFFGPVAGTLIAQTNLIPPYIERWDDIPRDE